MERYDESRVERITGTAVVIGGSMAGLCAARVLADVFDDVIIIERDTLSDEAAIRGGAPQTSQPHALLEAGRATLEDLFPGFTQSVRDAGGLALNMTRDIVWYDKGDTVEEAETPLSALYASRPLFEHVVRKKLRTKSNISFRDGCHFLTYTQNRSANQITGIKFRDEQGEETTLESKITIDASGRASKTPSWLANNGYAKPDVDRVNIDVTYSTVCISRSADDHHGVLIAPEPGRPRGAAMLPIEQNQWQILLQGVHGERAPVDKKRFISWAAQLPIQDPVRELREQQWLTDIRRYPFPASVRHKYHTLRRFPDRFVVIGDAVASFNPIYGQGMSVAALDSLALHHALSDGITGVGPRVFDLIKPIIHEAWRTAVGNDFIFDETTGSKPFATDLLNIYASQLVKRAHDDGILTEAFLRVFRLERQATSLLHPRILWRTLRPNP